MTQRIKVAVLSGFSGGMNETAKASWLTREALHKALRPDVQPRLDAIGSVFAFWWRKPSTPDPHRLG